MLASWPRGSRRMSRTSRTLLPISRASMRVRRCKRHGRRNDLLQLGTRNKLSKSSLSHEGEFRYASVVRMEGVKQIVEQMTGWSRPDAAQLMTLVRERKANEFRFADDGFI